MEGHTRPASGSTRGRGVWKTFFLLLLVAASLWGAVSGIRILSMADRVDHYIYETNFVGHALVVLGVPGEAPLAWNDSHNGWDIPIPARSQVLLTSTPASDLSIYGGHYMRREDGSLLALPYQTPTAEVPFAALGPRSGPMPIDLDAKTYVEFWTYSPMVLCAPCPKDVIPAPLASRDAVRAAAKDELLRRIRSGELRIEALDVRDTQ